MVCVGRLLGRDDVEVVWEEDGAKRGVAEEVQRHFLETYKK